MIIGLELVEGFPVKLNDFVLIIELVNKIISGKVVYQIILIGSSCCLGNKFIFNIYFRKYDIIKYVFHIPETKISQTIGRVFRKL